MSGQGEARFRLFCFPYFGGDADAFASWAGALPDEIEVHAIDLPLPGGGREALLAGPPEDFRRALVEAIREKSDLPFAFYGHSLGGIIALDIARDLPDHARPAFVALGAVPTDEALAAFPPTALADPSEVTDAMARDAMRQLRIADLTLDKETEARVLTLVRRDLWLVYHRDPARDAGRWRGIEGVPLYLFGGARDPVPTLDKGECPLAVEDTVIIAGAHLFTGERGAREELLRHLRVHIERALAP